MAIFSISAKAEFGILFRYGHGAVVHILEASDFEARDGRIGWRRAYGGIRALFSISGEFLRSALNISCVCVAKACIRS